MSLALHLVGSIGFWQAGIFEDLANPLLWTLMLFYAAPLILASTGGVLSERSGVVNIAMEGMMLVGAFFSAYTVDQMVFALKLPQWEGTFIGVLGAMAAGCLISAVLAYVCIWWRANQVVVGMAINIFALGLTSYLYFTIYPHGTPGNLPGIAHVTIPAFTLVGIHFGSLSSLQFLALGPIVFNQSPIVYVAFAAVILAHIFLFRTKLGLRIRSVGEHPRAADTAGLNVQRLRFLAVVLSGALSGLAGTAFSLDQTGLFSDDLTQGRGFIALAAMIVGKWTPFGALGACLLFGLGEALSVILANTAVGVLPVVIALGALMLGRWTRIGLVGAAILAAAGVALAIVIGNDVIGAFPASVYLINMVPYLITIIAVAGFVGRSTPPAADGIPYDPAEAA